MATVSRISYCNGSPAWRGAPVQKVLYHCKEDLLLKGPTRGGSLPSERRISYLKGPTCRGYPLHGGYPTSKSHCVEDLLPQQATVGMISYTSMGHHGEDLLPLRVTAGKISYLKEPHCGETLTSKGHRGKDLLHQRTTVHCDKSLAPLPSITGNDAGTKSYGTERYQVFITKYYW